MLHLFLSVSFAVCVIIQDAKTESYLKVAGRDVVFTKDFKEATKIEIEFLPTNNNNVLLRIKEDKGLPLYLDYLNYSNYLTPSPRSEHVNQRFTLTMNSSNNYDIVNNDMKFLYVHNDFTVKGGPKPGDSLGFYILADNGLTNYYDDSKSKRNFLENLVILPDGTVLNIDQFTRMAVPMPKPDKIESRSYSGMIQDFIATINQNIIPMGYGTNPAM